MADAHIWATVAQHCDCRLAGGKHVEAVHQVLDVTTPAYHHQLLGFGFRHRHAISDAAVALLNKLVELWRQPF